jgi:hypothetical protein
MRCHRTAPVLAAGLVAAALFTVGCGPSAADREAAASARAARDAADAKARAEADAAREADRMRALWTYADVPAAKGHQVSAAIRSTEDVDTGEGLPHSVLLVFRDHPAWGRSSYLVLNSGDFRCASRCTIAIAADGAPSKRVAAHRPTTHEAIALFIDDWRTLWRSATTTTRLSVSFDVKAGGTRTAEFDVGGLDQLRMPGWPASAR